MRKSIGVFVAAFALVTAQAASAQTFTTTPGTYPFSGTAVVQKDSGVLVSCTMGIDIINNESSITANNFVLTGSLGFCDSFFFLNQPYSVTVSGSTVSFSGVYIDTYFPAGDCAGTLTATFSAGPPEELSINMDLPEVDAGTGDCRIDGFITQ